MTTSSPGLVPLAAVEAAAERIRGTVVRTPLIPDTDLSESLGGEVRLKCESLQKAGAFKARGACNFMARLSPEELARGVITYSSGNHAQAVAFAAGLKGVRAVVVMPTTAPRVKSDGARHLGARVEFAGTTSEHRRARAEEIAEAEGLVMVPPFDHPWIIAGQGTVALEVFEDWPEVDTLVVPIGGGGQMAGCAAALRRLRPEASVFGVEPAGAPTMRRDRRRSSASTRSPTGWRPPAPATLPSPTPPRCWTMWCSSTTMTSAARRPTSSRGESSSWSIRARPRSRP